MNFPSVIPRTGQPHFPEASRQRSIRDTDSIPQSHKKHGVNTFQLGAAMRQIAEISRQLHRMRMRKPLGVGGNTKNSIRGEWDGTITAGRFATTYNFLDEVAITMGPNAGDWIWINPSAGNSAPYLGGANWFQRPIGGQGVWM